MDLKDIDLQELIYKELDQELRETLDKEMVCLLMMTYYKEQGWQEIELDKFQDNNHAVDITNWLVDHGFVEKTNYYRNGRKFLFKNKAQKNANVTSGWGS